jgi:CDP-diacylglycerol--glycerol-3-phosphate 3-phosphatidyltransferase
MAHPLLRDLRGIPNLFSLSRIVMVAVAVPMYLYGDQLVGVVLGIIAGVTDYLDGYIARKLNQVTYLGAVLDLFSDLVFETAAILAIALTPGGPPILVLFVYLLREFWVTTIRRFMAAHKIDIHSNIWGKLKSNFLGWGFMFYGAGISGKLPAIEDALLVIGYIGLYGGLCWSYFSGYLYTRQFVDGYARVVGGDAEAGR